MYGVHLGWPFFHLCFFSHDLFFHALFFMDVLFFHAQASRNASCVLPSELKALTFFYLRGSPPGFFPLPHQILGSQSTTHPYIELLVPSPIAYYWSLLFISHPILRFYTTLITPWKKQLSLDIKWHLSNSSQLSTIYPELVFTWNMEEYIFFVVNDNWALP